ncbi:MAG: nucleotidyltransferase domain-containing protein [Proteobacteria bacterium]|nr:nucleotidyltransferase domain-containing protein [Pseudomonadota bacterium]
MNAPLETILADLRSRLAAAYGPRLEQVVLFGSRARGDARPDSDIDVMIVLSGPLDCWQEVQRTSQLTSELSIRYDTDISRVFATPAQYARAAGSFYENVRREGVAA